MIKFAENGVGVTFLDCRSYVGTWEQFNHSAISSKEILKMASCILP
jgi:hypothetical protein